MNGLDGAGASSQKILVIDDQILFREGLVSLLRSSPDFEVVGSAGSVHEGYQQAVTSNPDIILMDFSLPDGTGLDATRAILAKLPECKIVFLTVHEGDEDLLAALRLGAKGYMLKNVRSSDLLSSLLALQRGEKAVSRKMMSNVMDGLVRTAVPDSKQDDLLSRLSTREVEVLREIESGATNLEIAQHLYLSVNTVKHHVRSILDKLGLQNRRQAASLARQGSIDSKSSSFES